MNDEAFGSTTTDSLRIHHDGREAMTQMTKAEEVGLERVGSILELADLVKMGSTCRSWHRFLETSEHIWKEQWLRRLGSYSYLPRHISNLADEIGAKDVLKAAVADEQRTALTLGELTEFQWRFRFKRAAGTSWMAIDPYYSGKPAMTVDFHLDGATTRKSSETSNLMNDIKIYWRWGNSTTLDPASGTPCDRVRANVDGQDVPTYVVSRHPRHKGFMMQSCWALYTAFPMPPPGEDPCLDDDALEIGFEQQAREALQYNRAQRVTGYVDMDAFDAILRHDDLLLHALISSDLLSGVHGDDDADDDDERDDDDDQDDDDDDQDDDEQEEDEDDQDDEPEEEEEQEPTDR